MNTASPSRREALRLLASGLLGASATALCLKASRLNAEDELKVGMSGALSGPAQALGLNLKRGLEAWIQRVNSAGGVHGRKLRLLALDDGYEPSRTGPNMHALIDTHRVFAVLCNPGTPTAAVAVPIANEARIPLFGAYTGAGLLRKSPPDRYIINYRASYAQETAEMVRGLTQERGLRPDQLGFFTQNDAFGDSGFAGAVAALERLGYADARLLPHGRYPRNTLDVEDGLAQLLDPRYALKAIIMVGTYAPCARFIKLARKHGLNALFANVSFVGADALARELGPEGEGVVVTQVVPHPNDDLPLLSEFRQCVPAPERNFISLEGFIVGRAFTEVLARTGPNPTPDRFISTLESGLAFDLGLEHPFQLSPSRHQFSDTIWRTQLKQGTFQTFTNWMTVSPAATGG